MRCRIDPQYVLENRFDKAEQLFNESWPNYTFDKRKDLDLLKCYNCTVGYAHTLVRRYIKKREHFNRFFISTEETTSYCPSRSH